MPIRWRKGRYGTAHQYVMQTMLLRHQRRVAREEAIEQIKKSIKKTYGKRGDAVVNKNFAAVDAALAHLEKVKLPDAATSSLILFRLL